MNMAMIPRIRMSPAASQYGGTGRNLSDMPLGASAKLYSERIEAACIRAKEGARTPHEILKEAKRHGVRENRENSLLEALAKCMLIGEFTRAREIIEEYSAIFDDSLVKGVAEKVAMAKYNSKDKEGGLKVARKYGLIALAAKMEKDFAEPSGNGAGKPVEKKMDMPKELGMQESIAELDVVLPWEQKKAV